MKALISYSPMSDRYVVEFVPMTGAASNVVDTDDGARLWLSPQGDLEMAAFDDQAQKTIETLFGTGWSSVRAVVRQVENADRNIEIDISNRAFVTESDSIAIVPGAVNVDSMRGETTSSDIVSSERTNMIPELESALGDGVPREVPVADSGRNLRAATVNLPEESGSEYLPEPRTARVAWDPRTGELKVKFSVTPGHRTSLWVRVGEGESGDLIALARPVPDAEGGAIASTIVPSKGSLGDLYIDVTDEPLAMIGSSRLRARRRAARLEGHAARLEARGRNTEARRFATHAEQIRRSLGDTSGPTEVAHARNRWWILLVLSLCAVIGVLLTRNEPSPEPAVGFPVVTGPRVLALEEGATNFSGDYPFSLAVDSVSSDGALAFQLYDQVQFAFAGGSIENPVEALSQCRGTIGSSTGASVGAVSAPVELIVLGSDDRSRALDLLTIDDWDDDEVFGRFSGMTSMIANTTEDCRTDSANDAVFQITRQIYDVESVTLERTPARYLVVRLMKPDGTAIEWNSTGVVTVK